MKKTKTTTKGSAQATLPNEASDAESSLEPRASKYSLQIPESQGDLADRAEIEIEQELQEQIQNARRGATVH